MVVRKRRLIKLIPGILQITIGLLFYLRPTTQLLLMLWGLSGALLISGIIAFVNAALSTFRLGKASAQWGHAVVNISAAIALIIIGPSNLAAMLPILSALWIIGSGCIRLALSLHSLWSSMRYWYVTALTGLLFLLIGILIYINTYTQTIVLGLALGSLFVISGVISLMEFFSPGQRIKGSLPGPSLFTRAFSPNAALRLVRKFIADNQWNVENNPSSYCEIFIHLADNRFEIIFGHVDIAIGNRVYSFSNYDSDSNKLFGCVSDGVLLVAPREEYVRYAVKTEEKILVAYEIRFSPQELDKLHAYLDGLIANSREFIPPDEGEDVSRFKNQANIMSYYTHCIFYKPLTRKFRTYFIIGTNCVRMVDEAIAATGKARHHVSGILMPGDYLMMLERELKKKKGYVTGRNIYGEGQ